MTKALDATIHDLDLEISKIINLKLYSYQLCVKPTIRFLQLRENS